VTSFVTSVSVFEAAIWLKSVYVIKSQKRINMEIKVFKIDLHLKDGLRMEFTAC